MFVPMSRVNDTSVWRPGTITSSAVSLLGVVLAGCGSTAGRDGPTASVEGGMSFSMDAAQGCDACAPEDALSGPLSGGQEAGAGEVPDGDGSLDGAMAIAQGTADAGGDTRPMLPPFGNEVIHPDRVSFYMVPDLESGYTGHWDTLKATFATLHALMPEAWVRWDNETGHNTNDQNQVSKVVGLAATAGVPMIVTAAACPNYNNMWANRYVTGNSSAQANASIVDIAHGGFLGFTASLAATNANVQLVETLNEPDGPGWFVTDPDNSADFDVYMSGLYAALGVQTGNAASAAKLLGPAVAFEGAGNIWKDWMSRSELTNVSYHTYGEPARAGLHEVPGKKVYVTEYGFSTSTISPALLLDDLWNIEKSGAFSGGIQKVFYNQILQNGSNPAAFSQSIESGQSHFAERGWFRALAAWVALGSISNHVERDDANPDYLASDDRNGRFGILLWNNSDKVESGLTRTVMNTSPPPDATLHVLHVLFGNNMDAATGRCSELSGQNVVSAVVAKGSVSVTVNTLASEEAVYLSTSPCDALAN